MGQDVTREAFGIVIEMQFNSPVNVEVFRFRLSYSLFKVANSNKLEVATETGCELN